jgi:molybdopterin-guanine dinucleotide biosynthesis protein A
LKRLEAKVTTGCSHSDPKKNRLGPFTFNPYEIAVAGPDANTAKMLVWFLRAGPFADFELAQVIPASEAPPFSDGLNQATYASDHLGMRLLAYPDFEDEYLAPRPLFDADAVLVEGDAYPAIPKLVAVGDGGVPKYENVLAYVGHPDACPVLPSDANYLTLEQQDAIGETVLNHFFDKARATKLKGLILAGGESTRMQRDKAALEFHGKPQIDYVKDLLRAHCDEVFVSIRPDQTDDPVRNALPQISDAFLGFGPMGGILSALKSDAHAAWLVVACDLPFVDAETLDVLVEGRNPFRLATAYTSARDGFPEPLCAIYEPKSVMRMTQFLALGYHCPRKVLINSRTHLLEPPNDAALSNVNHPDEYEAALKALHASK